MKFYPPILPSIVQIVKSYGGGVLIAVNDKISSLKLFSPANLEVLSVRLNLPNSVTVCTVYIPPNITTNYYKTLFGFLSNFASITDNLIILGDFNFPDIDWDSLIGHLPAPNQFCDLVFQSSLSQLVSVPTHNQGNILDLVLTNIENNISDLQVHSVPLLISDHLNITFSLSTCVMMSAKQTTYFTFNYREGDYQGLHDLLCDFNFTPCYVIDDVEYIWHITAGMELFIPVNKVHSDQHPVWFSSEITHCINRLRTLRRRYKWHPTYHISNTIDLLEKSLQDNISTAKQNYESHLINNFASINNNKLFKYLKSITRSNNNPPIIMNFDSSSASTDSDKANLFNKYFHSVFHDPCIFTNTVW